MEKRVILDKKDQPTVTVGSMLCKDSLKLIVRNSKNEFVGIIVLKEDLFFVQTGLSITLFKSYSLRRCVEKCQEHGFTVFKI